jgi:hypothetical protein
MTPELERLTRELTSLKLALTSEIQRAGVNADSRWSGAVILDSGGDYEGVLRTDGSIALNPGLSNSPLRWRTLIHELLHSFSAGGSQATYMENRGWEEGPVEYLQRRLRPELLHSCHVTADESVFQEYEATWKFNRYVESIERLCVILGNPEPPVLCLRLLAVPIGERKQWLSFQAVRSGRLDAAKAIGREHENHLRINLDIA